MSNIAQQQESIFTARVIRIANPNRVIVKDKGNNIFPVQNPKGKHISVNSII